MTEIKRTKLQELLSTTPPGIVLLSSWLKENGYSHELQKQYKKSGWLESIGTGASIICNQKVDIFGAIYAIQNQGFTDIHIGGQSALKLYYNPSKFSLKHDHIDLFGHPNERLPGWFKKYNWESKYEYHPTSLLYAGLSLTKFEYKDFAIKISSPEKAILEALYLASDDQDLRECYYLLKNIPYLNPDHMFDLLTQCNSFKVKRLFLYIAEKIGHQCFHDMHLEFRRLNLGTGKQSSVKNGKYISKYKITVPITLI